MKKIVSLLVVACLVLSCCLCSCGAGGDPVEKNKAVVSNDKYRNFYQIWIGSFCDSNNDETGDIPGIISKLDYLNDGKPDEGDDLGIDGIWLSPMMPSYSYHKYNVEDYFNIDKDFGTLDDFDTLIAECDKRGIEVIIDLVVNHSASTHPYFKKACEELKEGKEDGYAKYYRFKKGSSPTYSRRVKDTDYFYEGAFSFEMPDWNLSYQGTRDYFEEIVKFWLDRGVDGFRLDAVKYFNDEETDGEEFLSWFYNMAKKYNENVYMVGEDWDDSGKVYDMYKSGIDSLFNFKFANTDGVYVSTARSGQTKDMAAQLKKYNGNILKRNEKAINANFLTNHDMVRVANMLDEDENKFAAALYMLSPGNSFTYYGEEIGITAPNTTNDASYRTAMIWDNDELPDIYVNGVAEVTKNELGGVKQQLEQKDSMLNFYRRLIKIKNQNPEIARGEISDTLDFEDGKIGGYKVEYNGTTLLVIHNGNREEKEVTLTDDMATNPELRGYVVATNTMVTEENADTTVQNTTKGEVKLNSKTLTLPPLSSVVIKAK